MPLVMRAFESPEGSCDYRNCLGLEDRARSVSRATEGARYTARNAGREARVARETLYSARLWLSLFSRKRFHFFEVDEVSPLYLY